MTTDKPGWRVDAPTLPLVLSAPLQSWGHQSIFRQRGTLPFPTHSALVGIIAAAKAVDRNDPEHTRRIGECSGFHSLVCRLPAARPWHRPAPVLEDYHTVENARTASGGTKETELTRRLYLQDATFIALLQGDSNFLEEVAPALKNPVWGGWLGRRACIASLPLIPPGDWPASDAQSAWDSIRQTFRSAFPQRIVPETWDQLPRVQTADSFADGTDTWLDMPGNFQNGNRRHNARRVKVTLAGEASYRALAEDLFPSPLDAMESEDETELS